MNGLELLLNKRWIVKAKERELYYQMKDEVGKVKKFLTEKLGYQVIVNPYLIKVEKMPAKSESWMGIMEFTEKIEYVFLCMILMFLEDKEAQEQFVLSELTEYIQSQYKEVQVDWTLYHFRRNLIKVIKFCVNEGMFLVDDGSEENFAKDTTSEVLYENTGVSRYFMKNFTRNIMDYTSPLDFEKDEWIDVNADRGIVRRQRVYRELLMSIGMYKEEENDEDFAYVRNYRNMIGGELGELFDCELQVHRTSAFLIMGENGNLGRCFPEENTLSDITLLCSQLFLKRISVKQINVPADERIILKRQEFRQIVEDCKEQYGSGLIKTYREMTTSEFYEAVKKYMEQLGMIENREDTIVIKTVVGKMMGRYPKDFQAGGQTDEQ
ncbi:MAG: TIGR02678 family protein [Lachnospiraceae bacterium]